MLVEQIRDGLARLLLPYGIDLISSPVNLSTYNNHCILEKPELTLPFVQPIPADGDNVMIVLGNTRAIWCPFIHYLRAKYVVNSDVNILITTSAFDDYVEDVVTKTTTQVLSSYRDVNAQIYWSMHTMAGRLVAIQKLVHLSGLAFLDDSVSHLCIHPIYGPWISFKTVIVLNINTKLTQIPLRNPMTDMDFERLTAAFKIAIEDTSSSTATSTSSLPSCNTTIDSETSLPLPPPMSLKSSRKKWILLRCATSSATHPHIYSSNQLYYHYSEAEERKQLLKLLVVDFPTVPPTHCLTEHVPLEALKLRRVIIDELIKINDTSAKKFVLLSGGLDSSIIVEATNHPLVPSISPILSLQGAICVQAHSSGTDLSFSKNIAEQLNLNFMPLQTSLKDILKIHLPILCNLLMTFDPMELRNSIVVSMAIAYAAEKGVDMIVTGDGADELFGGYSFTHNLDAGRFKNYQRHLAKVMKFAGAKIAETFSISYISPFTQPAVVDFALALPKELLVGSRTLDGKSFGKLLLRQAFPEVSSQWRDKEPIEVGSGTTHFSRGEFFNDFYNDEEFVKIKKNILKSNNVFIRDKEHLYYYQSFIETYGDIENVRSIRMLQCEDVDVCHQCPGCLCVTSSRDQDFCYTCGHYPVFINEEKHNSVTIMRFKDFLTERENILVSI